MATTSNKQATLTHIVTALKDRYDPATAPVGGPRKIYEELLYAVCRENASRELADPAFETLSARFVDWNELRVSSEREVADALGMLPDAADRAKRLISLVQEIFDTDFTFDLQPLEKKGLKQAERQLLRYKDVNRFRASWVVQQALGGHAVPVDDNTRRVLERVGVLSTEPEEEETGGPGLEHHVPKAKGPAFTECLSLLALELCHEESPQCGECPVNGECPHGQAVLAAGKGGPPRVKSR